MLFPFFYYFYLPKNYHINHMKRYKIGFLTSFDPLDKRKLSGVTYHLLRAVQSNLGDVELLGPMKTRRLLSGFISRLGKKFSRPYNVDHSLYMALRYAGFFNRRLKGKKFDLIIAPRSSTEIAFLKTDIPVLYYSDTTFYSLYNYYEWFSNFMPFSVWEGNRIERLAHKRSRWVVFTSQWAADSAINHYKTDPSKVHVIPFGPNLDEIPARDEVLCEKPSHVCKLLFLGVEWNRKGGDIAFDTLQQLKSMGLNATLTVCGCTPPEGISDENMTVIPYINKNNFDEYKVFIELLRSHHFLVLPTRAECFGVVFCEASAFAMPSITTDTGGIEGAVKNGVNGFRLPLTAGGNDYAQLIFTTFTNYEERYIPLSVSSRDHFENFLNWNYFTDKVRALLDEA